jgi:hypothetical protein
MHFIERTLRVFRGTSLTISAIWRGFGLDLVPSVYCDWWHDSSTDDWHFKVVFGLLSGELVFEAVDHG